MHLKHLALALDLVLECSARKVLQGQRSHPLNDKDATNSATLKSIRGVQFVSVLHHLVEEFIEKCWIGIKAIFSGYGVFLEEAVFGDDQINGLFSNGGVFMPLSCMQSSKTELGVFMYLLLFP